MKLIAIGRVYNEADIIESFVRHHAFYFDTVIILDDGSTDGTFEALCALRDEGLPLVVLREPTVGYEQSRYMTQLLHMAVDEFGADWVAPLDADEFIEPSEAMDLRDILRDAGPVPLALAWENFTWPPQLSAEDQPILVRRFTSRMPPRSDFNKVLIPAAIVDAGLVIAPGNHGVMRDGQWIEAVPSPDIHLCHFPIRSVEQYAAKVARGYLKYEAMPGWNREYGFHYIAPYGALNSEGIDQLEKLMPKHSRAYSAREGDAIPQETVFAPLRHRGGPDRLGMKRSSALQDILHIAGAMAVDRAQLHAARTSLADENSSLQGDKARLAGQLAHMESELDGLRQTQQQLQDHLAEVRRESADRHVELVRQSAVCAELVQQNTVLAEELRLATEALRQSNEALLWNAGQLAELTRANVELQAHISSPTFRVLRRLHDNLAPLGLTPRSIAAQVMRLRRQ
ncbi:glycosyltransferase family 2 protein [Roseococcus sp. YIM B11640]|uniref:glycosyltransferase family 2 protein n=1 Tax=Roseococcus sp. YIM B11640 TaxID=3133973 RepID=UPI003C7CF5AC